jgi:hypothetical protein
MTRSSRNFGPAGIITHLADKLTHHAGARAGWPTLDWNDRSIYLCLLKAGRSAHL